MKSLLIKEFRKDPSELEKGVKDKLLDIYAVRFSKFEEVSQCGKVTVESSYSPGYMNNPDWYGIVTITSKIKLSMADFKNL